MQPTPSLRVRLTLCLAAALVLAAAPAAMASPSASIEATYQKESAACLDGRTGEEKVACLRDAKAGRDEALRGGLHSADARTMRENATRRCAVHADESNRSACLRMATGEGSTTGTVAKGGVLKSVTTVIPAVSAASAASAASPN